MGRIFAVCLVFAIACGGDDPIGPKELVADPNVVTGCAPEPVAAGVSRAKIVACAEELPAGRLRSGRVGDIVLESSQVEVVIRGFGDGYYLMGTKAGGIVDAALLGRTDQVKEILPIAGLHTGAFDEIVITESGDDGPATVVVRGQLAAIPFVDAAVTVPPVDAIIEHHYILEPGAREVQLRTYLFPNEGASGNVQIGDVFFYGGVVDSWLPGKGVIEGASSAELIASVGGDTSYGLVYSPDVTAVQFADIANVKLGLGPSRTLGNPAPIERWLVIGDGSASSVTDRGWALRGATTGTLTGTTAVGVSVHVERDGSPVTLARAGSGGEYSLSLPPGSYTVWTDDPGRSAGAAQSVTIDAGAETRADLPSGQTGTLSLQVSDDSAAAIPARVVITGASSERRIEYAGADGTLDLALPPGQYTLVVSRGVEYDAFTLDPLTITADTATPVSAILNRELDTSGWISVDTHIHSEMSTDSKIALDARLLAVAAEGVEVAISTDHDFVTDYGPVIAELGLQKFVTGQAGIETSSLVWGHVNAWPLVPDYDKAAGDAIWWYGVSPGEVYAAMHARGAGVVVQLNHPYHSSSGNFDILDVDPASLTAQRDPAELGLPDSADLSDFGFDALEVANDLDKGQFDSSLAAWLAMVAAGHPAAATGSSDSHGRSAYIGNSRTYVYVGPGNDDPATVSIDAINAAIKARKVTVSQGAFITAEILEPGTGTPTAPGALANLSGTSDAQVHIKVQAPSWMPLAQLHIYAGTARAMTIPLDQASTASVRYDSTVTIPLAGADGFFVVLVEPAGAGAPVLGTPAGSFTNPLLYDRDGDGQWTP